MKYVNIQGAWALPEACRRTPAVQQVMVASSDNPWHRAYFEALDRRAAQQTSNG